MKISKLFHWLYLIVMMFPIFTIPIFAIYSHRHTIDSYSVQAEETKVVDFNQNISSYRTVNINGISIVDNGTSFTLSGQSTSNVYQVFTNSIDFVKDDVYYLRLSSSLPVNLQLYVDDSAPYLGFSDSRLYTSNIDLNGALFKLYVPNNTSLSFTGSFNVFNLTQMFGSGNEPSIEQFNIWYPDDYYSYTLSDKQLLKTGNYITYDDTDIGSQFIYSTYNVVDKYFNYDRVFNFGQLYDWLNMTFFNGGASLGFFIFWHLLIYWLLTSILWLVFDVLMYVPQLVHRWLDKASLS